LWSSMRFSVLPVTLACLLLMDLGWGVAVLVLRLLLELDWDISPCSSLL